MTEYLEFMTGRLVPAANAIIREMYDDYCAGGDIDIQIKSDQSPASAADRNAENALRSLIKSTYPDHGIWGEEFGAENVDREYVWVLDPLDGTREFLNRKAGQFGILIGLLKNGKPIAGTISDPMSGDLWSGLTGNKSQKKQAVSISNATVACTSPALMFKGNIFDPIKNAAKTIKPELNCIGFAKIVTGDVDAVIEADLSLHDITALIPVLSAAGCSAIDLTGQSYDDMAFNLSQSDENKYGIIATNCSNLADEILSYFKGSTP